MDEETFESVDPDPNPPHGSNTEEEMDVAVVEEVLVDDDGSAS